MIARTVAVFRCEHRNSSESEECGSRRDAAVDESGAVVRVPSCGVTHTDYDEQRYPDGSHTQIQTRHYQHHGPMVDTGERLDTNPFGKMMDELREEQRSAPRP